MMIEVNATHTIQMQLHDQLVVAVLLCNSTQYLVLGYTLPHHPSYCCLRDCGNHCSAVVIRNPACECSEAI